MTQPHEWKWDGRVTVMAGQTLIAILGTDGGPSAIAERARLIEAAPRMAAEIQRLQAQLRAAQTVIAGLERRAVETAREHGALMQRAADVQGQRDANAILTAEVEQLRPDAERYRDIRDGKAGDYAICVWGHQEAAYFDEARAPHVVDAAVDVARGKAC